MATFEVDRIAGSMDFNVRLKDAYRFRLICVFLAFVPLYATAVILICGIVSTNNPQAMILSAVAIPGWIPRINLEMETWQECLFLTTTALGLWLFLLAITGVPSLYSASKQLPNLKQNRAIALSYYSAAPLVWVWIPVTVFTVLIYLPAKLNDSNHIVVRFIALLFILLALAVGILILVTPASMLKRTTLDGRRAIVLFFTLPAWWIVSGFIIAVGLPAACLYVSIIVKSLLG